MKNSEKPTPKKSSQRMFSVYTVKNGNTRGRYLRYRTRVSGDGVCNRHTDFVGGKDDATLFLRFEDAREKALELKRRFSETGVFVVEISGDKLGKIHPVKEKP
jgi:hypothetical protein